MKKFKILMACCFSTFLSATGQNQDFSITGRAELDSGKILVIAQTHLGPDTLASSPISKGNFTLKGKIEEAAESFLSAVGYEGGFQFMLEPGEHYRADLKKNGKSFVAGGKLQDDYLKYLARVELANLDLRTVQKEVDSARLLEHYRTVRELQGKLEKIREEAGKDLAIILKRNENNLLGAYLQTAGLKEVKDIGHLSAVYEKLQHGAKSSTIGKILLARINALKKIDVASTAPDFTVQTPEGKDISLYSIKGKLKIIDFWASWCGPCRLENPNVVKVYNDFKDKGLVIFSVSLDEKKDAWIKAIKMDGMPWYHGSSLDGYEGEVVQKYQIDAVPAIFILNEKNEIVARDLRGDKLRAFLEEYLNPKEN